MKKILITGAAGFVGRRLTAAMLQRGYQVHAVDSIANFSGALDPLHGWPFFQPLDYSNFYFYRTDCREWFKKNHDDDFDYVFHAAAVVGGRLVLENNPLAVAEDLSIDASYWNWAKNVRPKKTICFSSSAAYPVALQTIGNYFILKESMINFSQVIGVPDMTYGWAKLTAEYLAKIAHDKYGLRSVVYRPFSGYGPDQDLSYPVPSICRRIVENKGAAEIEVLGNR